MLNKSDVSEQGMFVSFKSTKQLILLNILLEVFVLSILFLLALLFCIKCKWPSDIFSVV